MLSKRRDLKPTPWQKEELAITTNGLHDALKWLIKLHQIGLTPSSDDCSGLSLVYYFRGAMISHECEDI